MEYDAQLAEIRERLKNLEKNQDWIKRYLQGNGSSLPTKVAVLETKQIDTEEDLGNLRNEFDSHLVRSRATQEALEQVIDNLRGQLDSMTAKCPTVQQMVVLSFTRKPLRSTIALIAIIAALHYFEGAIALILRLFSSN